MNVHKLSRLIRDEIEHVLVHHYALSAERLDFIIRYGVKYRMGAKLEGMMSRILNPLLAVNDG